MLCGIGVRRDFVSTEGGPSGADPKLGRPLKFKAVSVGDEPFCIDNHRS